MMESNIEIFDREGNTINIYNVVASFILEQESKLGDSYSLDDITIGVETYSEGRKKLCIYDLNYALLGSKGVTV